MTDRAKTGWGVGLILAGTTLIAGSMIPISTITQEEVEANTWRPTPVVVRRQQIPLSPVFQLIGAGLLASGFYFLWKGLEYKDPTLVPEPQYEYAPSQSFAPPPIARPYRPQTIPPIQSAQSSILTPQSEPTIPAIAIPQGGYKPQTTVRDVLELTDFLTSAAQNRLSLVFSGPPGIGKTTTTLAWMYCVFQANPDTQFFIISRKRDRWLGLGLLPEVFQQIGKGEKEYEKLFRHVGRVFDILYERMDLDPEDRKNCSPVWLILDDWFSITNTLNKASGELKKQWETCLAQIGDIVTLGREERVGVCVSTHSLNLAALGVAEDANIRSCLSICALGRIVINEKGQREGGYDAIKLAMRNPYIIDDEYRPMLANAFPKLVQASEAVGQPIMLTTMGETRIGLLPNLTWVENVEIPVDTGAIAERLNQSIEYSDFDDQLQPQTPDVWEEQIDATYQ